MAALGDYEEARELALEAGDVRALEIKAGAGSMTVRGTDAPQIDVQARVIVPDTDPDKASRIIERDLRLVLERAGDTARLEADFAGAGWFQGRQSRHVVSRYPRTSRHCTHD